MRKNVVYTPKLNQATQFCEFHYHSTYYFQTEESNELLKFSQVISEHMKFYMVVYIMIKFGVQQSLIGAKIRGTSW